jgi:hypothetical protein
MRSFSFLAGLVVMLVVAAISHAQTSYPMITHTSPVAVQRGQTNEVTVEGQMNFAGAYKVLFDGPGLSAEIVPGPAVKPGMPPAAVRAVKLKITAAKNAALGVHEFRIACNLGLSSVGQLVVVDDPVVEEKGDNNSTAKANPLPISGVACGRIEAAEDVDFFKFHADAGQTITFEMFCARIEDKIHDLQKHADPYIAVYDAEGREVAANDDFYFADSWLSYTFAMGGDFFVQVRDSKYDGDPRWVYALVATSKPYVSHVYPMAGNPGQTVEVEPVGSAKSAMSQVPLKVPADLGLRQVELDIKGQKTNPAAFIVSPLPQVLETEPNDTPEQATKVTLPCGINGKIGVRRDLDHFRFQAAKGKAIRFEVKARRFGTPLQSSLDSVLDILNAKGDFIATGVDDNAGKDAFMVFTPPADGEYVLRIRDLNSKGGDTFVYHIEADWAVPDFTARIDCDKAMIGPGSSTTWYVHVVRIAGFDAPVKIDVQGLPKGVTVNPLTIPATMTQGILVVTADATAPRDAVNIDITATGTARIDGKDVTLTRWVQPNQEIYSPGGGRARFDVTMQSVAVTDPSDILKVEVSPEKITLKPGEEVKIDVTVHRRADYDKAVSLDIMLRHLTQVFGTPLPPGVTMVEAKSKTLLGTGNKGHIVLKADPKAAPIENVPVSVLCHVSINFVVKVSYSSVAIPVTVTK